MRNLIGLREDDTAKQGHALDVCYCGTAVNYQHFGSRYVHKNYLLGFMLLVALSHFERVEEDLKAV